MNNDKLLEAAKAAIGAYARWHERGRIAGDDRLLTDYGKLATPQTIYNIMHENNKLHKSNEYWQHQANEWADTATSGLQWLKNIKDGISTPQDAINKMEQILKIIRSIPRESK